METNPKNTIILQVGVKIFLQNDQGEYLLLYRSQKKYPEARGRWDIVGGRISPGTTLFDNLKREVKEETGLEITSEPKLIAAQDILHNAERHVVRLTYVGKAQGELKLDAEEHDDFKWFTRAELEELDDLDIYFKELLSKNLL